MTSGKIENIDNFADTESSAIMDGTRALLRFILDHHWAEPHLRGCFHIAIGRTVTLPEPIPPSKGVTWRELAQLLTELQYNPLWIASLGLVPSRQQLRDLPKLWYTAIGLSQVDSQASRDDAGILTEKLATFQVIVGPAPLVPPQRELRPIQSSAREDEPEEGEDDRKKKRRKNN